MAVKFGVFVPQGWKMDLIGIKDPVEQGCVIAHVRVLLEQDDPRPRHDSALALVGVDQARQALQERRLASAIATDQRKPVARTDMDVEVSEQPAFALDEPEVFIG